MPSPKDDGEATNAEYYWPPSAKGAESPQGVVAHRECMEQPRNANVDQRRSEILVTHQVEKPWPALRWGVSIGWHPFIVVRQRVFTKDYSGPVVHGLPQSGVLWWFGDGGRRPGKYRTSAVDPGIVRPRYLTFA